MNLAGITRRRGRGATAGAALTLSLVTAVGCTAFAAGTGGHAAGAGPVRARFSGVLAAGQEGSLSAVPWRRVGAGWVLAEYWAGRRIPGKKPTAGAAYLYLVNPAGGRYQLYRWRSSTNPPGLVDWSGDKTRALLSTTLAGGLEQLVLATGKVTRLRLAGQAAVIGYTRPDGLNLLGSQQVGLRTRLARYTLTGRRDKVLTTIGMPYAGAVYSATGTMLAVAAPRGLELVSNGGGVIRTLPVPRTTVAGCSPSRWWNSKTILATCIPAGNNTRSRLWLVPASGGRPSALTPQRGARSRDFGDIGAWQLRSGLYLQALGACGTLEIARQAANGSIAILSVPGSRGSDRLLTAQGDRLLVESPTGCFPGASLLWFNPSSRHANVLFTGGVIGAVPFGRLTSG